ncbi:MAG TPA: anthranilate phosphoribosyltransferase [Candidatus Polarisedimenticolia bacterium]|jgi:anthranilate phosphoribosyltransferase|nr:anthranilate phosphoribosyltransferase [Candidatus Polarisedimenticolia bacterium]
MGEVGAALRELVEGRSLAPDRARSCFEEIMAGGVPESLLGGFLVALRVKGETPDEIAAFAAVMRETAQRIVLDRHDLLDTCGTGGDGLGSFNVSTLAALVAAGAGAIVAKHGNRAVSGKCGSADLLARLGVDIQCGESTVARCIEEAGIGFLFAEILHPAMRHAAPARRALGVRTVFNLLGPLTHPARASYQLLGVFDRRWVEPVALALRVLGTRRALVVHGLDGMDEITTTAPSLIAELDAGEVRTYELDPRDLGIPRSPPADLAGGDAAENERIARHVLAGEGGARRDLVLVNAGAALYAARVARDFGEGLAMARDSLDRGEAWRKLEDLVRITRSGER